MINTLRALLSLVLPAAAVAAGTQAGEASGNTLQNLQTAFEGESNAYTKYRAFAAKADEEGYAQAASLFRAAARAEEIHAANHAALIKKMGETPQAKIETPIVKSTRENLEAAMQGEIYERNVMYPEFIAIANKENNPAAVRTFHAALQAEAEHARMYGEAIQNLEQMKNKAVYYVCAVCGYTVEKLDFLTCVVCKVSKEKFEAVS
jgi:rubrerythrin